MLVTAVDVTGKIDDFPPAAPPSRSIKITLHTPTHLSRCSRSHRSKRGCRVRAVGHRIGMCQFAEAGREFSPHVPSEQPRIGNKSSFPTIITASICSSRLAPPPSSSLPARGLNCSSSACTQRTRSFTDRGRPQQHSQAAALSVHGGCRESHGAKLFAAFAAAEQSDGEEERNDARRAACR